MASNFFDQLPNRMKVINGGATILDTAAKHFNRIPTGELVLSSYAITFPNFANLSYAYFYTQPSGILDECTTLGRIPPQEWSNSAGGGFNLPDILLGALPIGTDYIEVVVNLARTTTPPQLYNARNWPIDIIENVDMPLLGGSCLVERMAGMCRLFDIVKVDTVVGGVVTACNAYLRRKMTITAQGAFVSAPYAGIYTHVLDNQSGNGASVRSTDPGHCSFVNSRNYSSVYTGTITITPCRYT